MGCFLWDRHCQILEHHMCWKEVCGLQGEQGEGDGHVDFGHLGLIPSRGPEDSLMNSARQVRYSYKVSYAPNHRVLIPPNITGIQWQESVNVSARPTQQQQITPCNGQKLDC